MDEGGKWRGTGEGFVEAWSYWVMEPEDARGVGLWVEVYEEGWDTSLGNSGGEVYGCGCFSNSSFLIYNRNDAHEGVWAVAKMSDDGAFRRISDFLVWTNGTIRKRTLVSEENWLV